MLHHNSLECTVLKEWEEIIDSRFVTADNIDELMKPYIPEVHFEGSDRFIAETARHDDSKHYGELHYKFYLTSHDFLSTFEVRQCSTRENGFSEFHRKFESLIFWYIDAASRIDLEDPNWDIFYL